MKPFGIFGTFLLVIAIIVAGIWRMFFVTFVDNYEAGYRYNLWTGSLKVVDRTGFIPTMPFVNVVHTIDMRPMQVCINANRRVLNCKLVQFNKKGLEQFVSWHGRDNYNGPGNGNASINGETSTFADILKSYAYDGTGNEYPFLTILRDLKTEPVKEGGK